MLKNIPIFAVIPSLRSGQSSFVQNDKLPYVIVNTVLMVKTVSLSIFIQVYDIGDFESIKGFRQRVAG